MSLSEIKGTALGTKMGIKTVTQLSTPKVGTYLGANKTVLSPGIKVSVPFELKATAPVVNILNNAFGDTKTNVANKVSAVTKQLTTAQKDAINQATQLKYGMAVVTNPSNAKMISTLRTIATVTQIKKSGLEFAPKGTTEALYNADVARESWMTGYNALSSQNDAMLKKQQDLLSSISSSETTLMKATNELGVTKGQLELTTTRYEDIVKKYNDLLNNPPKSGDDILTWITKNWMWVAVGVGAIVLLPTLVKAMSRGRGE